MARITVLGGTGYAGAALVAEARKRGHDVTAVSRSRPDAPVDGVSYVEGSVLDPDVLGTAVQGADVVVSALSPRGDMAGRLEGVVEDLVARLSGTPTRFGYVGGASSLLVEEGGPRLWDVSEAHIPDDVKPEIRTGLDTLEILQASPDGLDW
uniref:NAD(P)-dependent oxidoreductase n=1 Tax=Cellulomonas telluris TaxID=2306636 RepID=UPI0010A7BAD9